MNYICTWLCADQKGEESVYHQTGEVSSSQGHLNIYWRCIVVFYITSKRLNSDVKHLFFTNVISLPQSDELNIAAIFKKLDVEVVHTDFKYKTPNEYYGAWRNQFYEFSILEYISKSYNQADDNFLILDSDCIFLKPAKPMFDKANLEGGFLSHEINYSFDHIVNGISRNDMKDIYQDMLHTQLTEVPAYHAGEFFLASLANVKIIFNNFLEVWPQLLKRNQEGLKKLNEEAHTLSYIYFNNNLKPGGADPFIKRIWTNPVFSRNVTPNDTNLTIWHLPAEKTFGLPKLFDFFLNQSENYGLNLDEDSFKLIIETTIGIPRLSLKQYLEYYFKSYYKAIKKRVKNKFK